MRSGGIYVPDKVADREGEENSVFYNLDDLYRQAKKCSAIACVANDREERKLGTKYEVTLCDLGGLNGVHIECENPDTHKPDFFCHECKEPLAKLARQERVTCIATKETSLELLESELMLIRDKKSQQEAEMESKFGSPSESLDREVSSAFTDKDLVSGNLRLEADLDSSMRERNQLAGCIQNWTEELNRADMDEMGEDGLRNERRIKIGHFGSTIINQKD